MFRVGRLSFLRTSGTTNVAFFRIATGARRILATTCPPLRGRAVPCVASNGVGTGEVAGANKKGRKLAASGPEFFDFDFGFGSDSGLGSVHQKIW